MQGLGRNWRKQAIREENKKSQWLSFCLSSHPVSCSAAHQGESDYLLLRLVRVITSITSICSTCQDTPGGGTAIHGCLSQVSTQTVPMAKKVASFARATGEHVHRWDFPKGHAGGTIWFQETGDSHFGLPHSNPVVPRPSAETPTSWKKPDYISFQPLLQLGHWWHQWPFWYLQGN